jgi:Flp pilus assembly pilin Flp
MIQKAKSLLADTRGVATIEYLIIAGLVALLCIGAWRTFGTNVQGRVNAQAGQVNGIR